MNTRPQDRIHRKPPKPPSRLVRMQLPEDLVERIEAMAARQHLRFHSMIYALLCSGVDGHAKPAKRLQIVPPAVPPIDL